MTLENPFFVVKDEVCKALNKNRGLYGRWSELQNVSVASPTGSIPLSGSATTISRTDELDWTTTELRKALRSIEWDLDDLEDTICIVEKNPTKFKIDNKELTIQRSFIEQAREEVKHCEPKNVMLVHGEFGKMEYLKEKIKQEFGVSCYNPANDETCIITTTSKVSVDVSLVLLKAEAKRYSIITI